MKSMICAAAVVAFAGSALAGSSAFLEDFEGAAQYTTSVAEFSDGGGDFWGNTQNISFGGFVEHLGADGDYFTGMDLDGEGASLPLTITFDTFSIAGLTDLVFSVDLAEDDDPGSEDWDAPDFVAFDYMVDGSGTWTNIFTAVNNGDTFNSPAFVNGVEITNTFANFSADLTGVTGTDMTLRVVWSLDSGDEDLAIDNVSVTGIPAPGAAALFGLAGLTASRRRRG